MNLCGKIFIATGTLAVAAAGTLGLACCDSIQKKILLSVLERQGFKASADSISIGIFSEKISAENLRIARDGNAFTAQNFSAEQECFLGFLPSRFALKNVVLDGQLEIAGTHFDISAGGDIGGKGSPEQGDVRIFNFSATLAETGTAELDGEVYFDGTKIVGNAKLQIHEPEIHALPELNFFVGNSDIKIDGDLAEQKFSIKNSFSFLASEPSKIVPELEAFPPIEITGNAESEISPSSLFVKAITASIKTPNNKNADEIASIKTEEIFVVKGDDDKWQIAGENPRICMNFSETPLAVANPFLKEHAFTTGTLSGDLEIVYSKEKSRAENAIPTSLLTFKNASIKKSETIVFYNATGTLSPQISCDENELSIKLLECKISSETKNIPGKKLLLSAAGNTKISREKVNLDFAEIQLFETQNEAKEILSSRLEKIELLRGNIAEDFGKCKIPVRANAFPLSLLNSTQGDIGIEFFGKLTGTLGVKITPAKIEICSDGNALEIENFNMLGKGEKPLLENLSLKSDDIFVSVGKNPDERIETNIRLTKAHLRDAESMLVEGDLRLTFCPEFSGFDASLTGTLSGICRQPMFSAFSEISDGNVSINGNFDLGKCRGNASLQVENLRFRGLAERVAKSVFLNINAPKGGFADSPDVARLRISVNKNSELRIKFSELHDLSFGENPGAIFKGAALIPLADYSDFAPLSALFFSDNVGKESAVEMADKKRFADKKNLVFPWKNSEGEIDFRILEMRVPGKILRDIKGNFRLSKEAFEVFAASEKFLGGNARAKMKISAEGNDAVHKFDAGVVIKKAEFSETVPAPREGKPPILEGKFDLNLRLRSHGKNEDELAENFSATGTLFSNGGRVRIFSSDNKNVEITGELTELGGNLAGVFVKLTSKANPKISRIASGAQKLQKYLSDFTFEELKLATSYRFGNPLNFGEILLRNNEVCFNATGTLTPLDTAEICKWPIHTSAKFGVRGELEEAMTLLKLTDGTVSPDGYLLSPEINFTGTLDKASDNIFDTLYKSALPLGIREK